MKQIHNPVLTGFNPDPLLFRDDEKYYLVVSTFEWLPGIRIYSSQNLANWKYETSVISESMNINFRGNPRGCSIWAPFATYHNGKYYVVYTNVNSTRVPYKDVDNYIVSANDIHGPWSKPVYINSSGFDPSIFFDGKKAYFLNVLWDYRMETHNKSCGIEMQEIDPVSFSLIGKPKKIFDGTSARKTEAPQIYKHNGYYYLMTAEGGTGLEHQETVARSTNIWGPYEVDPNTPLITSKDHPELKLQSAGHASLMETSNHEWYIAHLCTRPLPGNKPILGRETAIQKVKWTNDGWLHLANEGNLPKVDVPAPQNATPVHPVTHKFTDDLKHGLNQTYWNTLRQFSDPKWLIADSKGLLIRGGQSPQSLFDQHMIATRQCDFKVQVAVDMEYQPHTYMQLAGLSLYLDALNYALLVITVDENNDPVIELQKEVQGEFNRIKQVHINNHGQYHLEVTIDNEVARFIVDDGNGRVSLGTTDISFLSGGFTGNFIGLNVIDMHRRNSTAALFKNFSYIPF
ncbi:glycoside hydrolase family 43 protein [Limosilactobacillus sp. RRLNB_1_1]|uniref:Glycoside hydrolase family 43 protein n=1 Tax=Limosilactobacillus albertensis TaxID=2759752 RepID=A0A7W3Y8C4_9LACO|nr:glycoside hydrolase family 43 protein [Limosilactobacillus albertensis]MBB1069584.1 glycoside hydrolase family 43 protein [Limosilactobacillus albertensis]MCD7118111.1 glycoside hydrolase family 43 protein [Limosilactobacillus albertensis]MCD7127635.1 glycoside hydrolase family 43 protein [Limosilactobacillus albertensis]